MFAHLKGIIDKTDQDHFVIDVKGVGYYVFASRLTLSNMTKGDSVKVHIETMMRQEALQLFGFLSFEELSWFRILLTVQGVGPKVALGIIGSLGLYDLLKALVHQDKAMLARADGVGPKLAGRILLELKDKCQTIVPFEVPSTLETAHNLKPPHSSAMDDALSALINLGYSRFEAQKALSSIPQERLPEKSSELIRLALQQMQRAQTIERKESFSE